MSDIEKIKEAIKEGKRIEEALVADKGISALRIPNKDLLFYLIMGYHKNEVEIEKLKVKFYFLVVLITGLIIGVFSNAV